MSFGGCDEEEEKEEEKGGEYNDINPFNNIEQICRLAKILGATVGPLGTAEGGREGGKAGKRD